MRFRSSFGPGEGAHAKSSAGEVTGRPTLEVALTGRVPAEIDTSLGCANVMVCVAREGTGAGLVTATDRVTVVAVA